MLFPHSEHWMHRPFISEYACRMLVNVLVTSRLDYGNALLYGITKHLTDKLRRVHNTAALLIARTKRTDHITPVPIHLHWLPVEYRSQYKLILYVFNVLHGLAPVYLTELVKPYVPSRCVPSQHHFSRYLPPEQRPMVTAVSTGLRQLCGTTCHSSSKLWTRYQF